MYYVYVRVCECMCCVSRCMCLLIHSIPCAPAYAHSSCLGPPPIMFDRERAMEHGIITVRTMDILLPMAHAAFL